MVAVKKIAPDTTPAVHSSRISKLLLDLNYKKHNFKHSITPTIEVKQSRIEAEYLMEETFKNLF